jgi:hypothetical protein
MPDQVYGIKDDRSGLWVEGCAKPGQPHHVQGTAAEMFEYLRLNREKCPVACAQWCVEPMTEEESRH